MSQPIVVPLDGSELAEAALPYAATFAKSTGAGLVLVTVRETIEDGLAGLLPDVIEDLFQKEERYYEGYLSRAGKKAMRSGVPVEALTLSGKPADEILALMQKRRARMLVLATHGRSGLGRWVYGSVAADLVQRAPVPTLIVGPNCLQGHTGTVRIRRILVPLDGSELSEQALRPAGELAEALGASIVLAQVLSWASQAFAFDVPSVTAAQIDQELTRASQEYLARVANRVKTAKPVRTRALHGMPADALMDLVADKKIDLVVMGSHGRGGLTRAALGSVADRMLQSQAPVLLVRPKAVARSAARRS
jgi:nucleotide-binding universal stress UspA family protein